MNLLSDHIKIPRPAFLGSGEWILNNTTPITVIFGRNGSGKSQMLRNFSTINKKNSHYIQPERAGGLAFEAGLVIQELDPNSRSSVSQSNIGNNYRQRVYTRIQSIIQKRGAIHSEIIPDIISPIEIEIKELLPEFEFKITGENPPVSFSRNGTQVNDGQLSSGEVQIFTLGLDILGICAMWKLEEQKGNLLIDEPDSHIHPDLQQKFAKFLIRVSNNYDCSIFVATHSTSLLSALGHYGGEKTSIIYMDNKVDLYAKKFDKELKLISTCLGGHALMGPLFDFPILLVEGDDDYKIWSQIPRHGKVKLSVIPCDGQEIYNYQETLEKIFASIRDNNDKPAAYALVDSDKSIDKKNQKYVKFLRLECLESENLYLTDEILLSIGLTWEQAKEKAKQEIEKFEDKELIRKIDSWDRKKIDCKSTINQLSHIWEDKLLWTQRIGKQLGNEKPKGQLAEFLGTEIVNSLFGNYTNEQ